MRRSVGMLVIAGLLVAAALPAGVLAKSAPVQATATLIDQAGNEVGSARFIEKHDGSVLVLVQASGLTPGEHGLHVHATGACTLGTTPAFSSAGSHFNPDGNLHGAHAGDLGNITANPAGQAHLKTTTSAFTLSAGTYSLLDADGSALVIHASPDDLVTNPTGNSGARIACGVISEV